MHPDWKEHLASHGALFDESGASHFGNETAERRAVTAGPVLLDLGAYHGLIRASGTDSVTFLNGQLTNDLRRLQSGGNLLAGYCTPQGRLLAIARVFRHGSDYFMRLPLDLRDAILDRLRRYVLRSKVTLEQADGERVTFGLAGPRAPEMLRSALGASPDESGSLESGDLTVLHIPGPRDRFELVGSVSSARSLWSTLQNEGARPVAGHWWKWFDVEAGIADVGRDTQEKFVPQTVNLELVGGVSFEKGCYPGQEIVARVHYLGRLKERMYRLHLSRSGDDEPKPGDAIYAPDHAQATGAVVQAHAAPDDGVDLLAVVHTSSVATGELRWRTPDGPRLDLRPLPYSLPHPG